MIDAEPERLGQSVIRRHGFRQRNRLQTGRVSAFKAFAVLLLAFTALVEMRRVQLSLYHRPGSPSQVFSSQSCFLRRRKGLPPHG